VTAIVLAAGKSKRMGTSVPKVLLPVRGRPLVTYVIDAARSAGAGRVVLVVGAGREAVRAAFPTGVEYAVQPEQKGTADAVLCCRPSLAKDEECVVLCGDAPLVRPATIRRLAERRQDSGATVAVFTARLADPSGYGRIVRCGSDSIERIVEERDATPAVLAINEVNSGAYAFRWGDVLPALERIKPSPVSGELYLTDIVAETRAGGGTAVAVLADDPVEMSGANTPEQLAAIERELQRRMDVTAA
jgi:bifunctional UDP-N-acetylglucosamine pyrophosphorylase / glucosamine-1-phosphate N-acetyltransferase